MYRTIVVLHNNYASLTTPTSSHVYVQALSTFEVRDFTLQPTFFNTETNITVGQRSISGRMRHVTAHMASRSDKMAGRKRGFDRSFSSSQSSESICDSSTLPSQKSKRQITVATFEKWQRNFDQDHATLTWLKCDKDKRDRGLVEQLWCSGSSRK